LTVDRIDFLRRTLRVGRQLISRNLPEGLDARACFQAPKTASSNRTIPLPTFVVDALADHLRRFPPGPKALVVLDPGGHPIDAGRFGYHWARACKTAQVEDVHFHDLRHTFASTLLSRGVSVKAVADWLGHSSPAITLSTYAHLMPTDDEVARNVLDRAFAADSAKDQSGTAAD
jgi:integrase